MPLYQIVSTIEEGGTERKETRLVSAGTQAKAIAHVVKDTIQLEVLSGVQALKLAEQGVKLEEV